MSIVGKGSLSLRKQDVLEQKSSGTAYRRLVFAHKATAGESGINFTSLVQPSEMASLGFTNPSAADILAANILFYKKNLTVISSARGVLMQDLSYTVPSSSRISFQGFTALQDEIFTLLLDTGVKDGLTIVDAAPIVATGELAVGQTDFNVGTPFEANKYNSQQVGAVLVFRDGVIQFRNPSNSTSGGNYQEVDNGSGLTSVIRFNEAPVSEASQIVVWGHLMAERPDASMTAAIESLAGQVDQMIPTLAAVAGVPESTFQGAPNNQDLKQFGDRLIAVEEGLTLKEDEFSIKYQRKFLPANISVDTPDIASLRFNNLTIGAKYRVFMQTTIFGVGVGGGTSVSTSEFYAKNNGVILCATRFYIQTPSGTAGAYADGVFSSEAVFIATASTVVFEYNVINGGPTLYGDGTALKTWVSLEEAPNHTITTEWT